MIAIRGIRITNLTIERGSDGEEKISAHYELLSTEDRVLAKQEIGGYQGLKIQPSASTIKLFKDALSAYKADVNIVLGLENA